MIIPIPKFITNPDYMMKAMDFEKPLLDLGLWNHGNTNMMHWVGMLSSKIIKGSISNLFSGQSNFTKISLVLFFFSDFFSQFFFAFFPCFSPDFHDEVTEDQDDGKFSRSSGKMRLPWARDV